MSSGKQGSNPPRQFVCEFCNTPFERIVYPSNKCEFRFCSPICRNKGRPFSKPKPPIENPPRTHSTPIHGMRIDKICKFCGIAFQVVHSHTSKQYCSIECYWKDMKMERTTVICAHCGKEFEQLESRGCTYCCHQCSTMANRGENHHSWKGGPISIYGSDWNAQSREAKKRDNHTCQICGYHSGGNKIIEVHHINPIREFDGDWRSANMLSNLITLCRHCHRKVEYDRISCPMPSPSI